MPRVKKRPRVRPEEVWAALRRLTAAQKLTDQQLKAASAAAERRNAELNEQMKETDRRIRQAEGRFGNKWGSLMEALVAGDLEHLLKQRGISVPDLATNVKKQYGGRSWELDIFAENGDESVVIEVKTKLRVENVDDFLASLNDLGKLLPALRNRKLYGAVAYLEADDSVTKYAERKGLFVIRAMGSTATITNRENFRPRVFGS